jgi:multisubunit Na+/H+ antiporter MnhB subunit
MLPRADMHCHFTGGADCGGALTGGAVLTLSVIFSLLHYDLVRHSQVAPGLWFIRIW